MDLALLRACEPCNPPRLAERVPRPPWPLPGAPTEDRVTWFFCLSLPLSLHPPESEDQPGLRPWPSLLCWYTGRCSEPRCRRQAQGPGHSRAPSVVTATTGGHHGG